MRLALIAAVAENGVIGRDNALPWHLPRDLRRFRQLTMGHHLLLGRKTFEAIGRPLPGRTMVVLSSGRPSLPSGVHLAHSLDEAIELAGAAGDDEPFVAGGEAIYHLAMPRADRIYLTRVHRRVEGDRRFPDLVPDAWREREREHYPVGPDNSIALTFLVLDRRR